MSSLEASLNLESLPDELLLQLFYELPLKDISTLCQSNSNLQRFCSDRPQRLQFLKREYRKRSNLDVLFCTLILQGKEERDIERLEAILDLHPEWVNIPLAFRYNDDEEAFSFRPLESSDEVKVILLLLSRGANPLLPIASSFPFNHRDSDIVPLGLSTEEMEESKTSILKDSLLYLNPTLHLLLFQNGFRLEWSQIDLTSSVNLDLAMHYVRHSPPRDMDFWNTANNWPDRVYFPILQLLQSTPSTETISDLEVKSLVTDAIACYRPLSTHLMIDTAPLYAGEPLPFYLWRQLRWASPDLISNQYRGSDPDAYLRDMVKLKISLHGPSFLRKLSLNYYQALGLIGAFYAFGHTLILEHGIIMDQDVHSRHEGISLDMLQGSQEYRFDPSVRFLPYLLRYLDSQGKEHLVQYEDSDYVQGFRWGLEIVGGEENLTLLNP